MTGRSALTLLTLHEKFAITVQNPAWMDGWLFGWLTGLAGWLTGWLISTLRLFPMGIFAEDLEGNKIKYINMNNKIKWILCVYAGVEWR